MNAERDDYVLGEDVTAAAKTRRHRGTTVLSVRLSTDEVARLEGISRSMGKTLSQVVREAIAAYEVSAVLQQPRFAMSIDQSLTIGFGQGEPFTGPLRETIVSVPAVS